MHAASTPGADLHLHSAYSDGTFAPEEIVAQSATRGVNPIALTDHDTVAGLPEALQAGAERNVEVIPGVELSAHAGHDERHILGYFVRWQDPTFRALLHRLESERRDRLHEILRRLHRLGISLLLSEVLAIAGHGTVGRLHVARALVGRGVVRDLDEAFTRFLAAGRPAYVERTGLTVPEAIAAIRSADGLAALAHPGTAGLDRLPLLVEAGLQGIEVFHPSHTTEDIVTLTRAATRYDLVITGGSDCHGHAKGEVRLGQVRLPLMYVERLRHAVASHPPHSTPNT